MLEFLLQESYAEWIVPLTIAAIWMSSLQLFSLSSHIQPYSKIDGEIHIDIFSTRTIHNERPAHSSHKLLKTVKRKECPDDSDEPHHLLI